MDKTNYQAIFENKRFKTLLASRNKFIFPISLFFVIATVLFPILTGYTNILNNVAFWNISWAWIYAFLLFIMVWTLVTIYMHKSSQFDKEAEAIVNAYREEQKE